jgi:thioredoxin 1
MGAVNVSPDELEGLLAEPGAVLVDFWGEWCGPCKAMAPVLDEIADEQAGKLTVAKLDVGAHPEAVQKYHVNGVPHMVLFEGGEVLARLAGAQSKDSVLGVVLPLVAE